jgi:hypothetical protein
VGKIRSMSSSVLPFFLNLNFLLESAALLNFERPSKVDGQVGLQDLDVALVKTLGVDNVSDGGFQLAQVEVLGALGVDDGGDGGFQLAQVEVLGEEASGALLGWRRYEI